MQINQEFNFLPTMPPRSEGGVFELRSYQLKPGALLEWEHAWCVSVCLCFASSYGQLVRRAGIEARRKFVEPVGAWFSQIGRLHEVHHLWQYEQVVFRGSNQI